MKKMNMNRGLISSAVVVGFLGLQMAHAYANEKISVDTYGPALHRTYVDTSAFQENGPEKRYFNGKAVEASNGPAKRYVKGNAGVTDAGSAEKKE